MQYFTNDKLSMKDYHAYDAVSNSDLINFQHSPAKYKWAKTAPEMQGSSKAADFGTALHTAILEPQKFYNKVLLSPTKGRDTIAFLNLAKDNPDKIVLTESEMLQIDIMQKSVQAHPTFTKYLSQKFDSESSIIVKCSQTGLIRKIRPDMNFAQYGESFLGDLKSTKSINDWRTTAKWKNPLFAYNYGHGASYYLDTASIFYDRIIDTYLFFVVQTTIEMGKYPVEVFEVSYEELTESGFNENVENNLKNLAECKDFAVTSRFPEFGIDSHEIEIITGDDNE
jgi:exodeoxyribonuclease VIII